MTSCHVLAQQQSTCALAKPNKTDLCQSKQSRVCSCPYLGVDLCSSTVANTVDAWLQGFAELEYGMLRWMGAVDDATLVVTTVHDCQVLETPIDAARMLEHDVPVDLIVTPTRVGALA
eukprot:350380-Chlamydomonas_euryale.AAC.1